MEQIRVSAGSSQACAKGRLKHITGPAGIFADNHFRLMVLSIIPAQEAADLKGMVNGQILVGFSAKTVGTKILTHFDSSSFNI